MLIHVFPLLGLLLLAWAALPARGRTPPPLECRIGAGILGAAWGWAMATLAYTPDAAHRVVGFPLPVYRWVNLAGTWTDQNALAALPCLVLDVLIGALLALRLLGALWTKIQPARARVRRR